MSGEKENKKHRKPIANNHARRLAAVLAVLVTLWPYALSIGDEGPNVSVVNGTNYYLHIVINNKSFLYVAPGGRVTYQLSSFTSAIIDVSYSPGQDKKGTATRTMNAELHTTSTGSLASDCNNTRSGCNSNATSSSNSTASVTPIQWFVTPADLSAQQ